MKRQKPKVLPTIAAAVAKMDSIALLPILPAVLKDLKGCVKTLQALFTRLEAMTKSEAGAEIGLNLLTEIVVAARELKNHKTLNTILRLSGSDANMVTSLTTSIIKLGRYSKAAYFLVKVSEGISIFSKIEISVVKLSPVSSLLADKPEVFLPIVLSSIFDRPDLETATAEIKARFTKKYPRACGIENILANIYFIKFVIYTEIQLLFYYKLHPTTIASWVICSSKIACFLCNLFMKLYRKFTIPSSHSKLYKK